jgi:hypothetical protein
MLDATRKKLREAQFFLCHLETENRRVVRNEPEAFDFLMSAFVSAGRSVTFALQAEQKEKYDQWFSRWRATRSEADQKVLGLMKSQRNAEQKEGGGERRVAHEYVSLPKLDTEELGGEVFWSAPLDVPPPQVGRPIRYFDYDGTESEALVACKQYYALLAELVEDFIEKYS